jgi:hypothetical protein
MAPWPSVLKPLNLYSAVPAGSNSLVGSPNINWNASRTLPEAVEMSPTCAQFNSSFNAMSYFPKNDFYNPSPTTTLTSKFHGLDVFEQMCLPPRGQ